VTADRAGDRAVDRAGDRLIDVLVFEVGGQTYGLAAPDVREIVRAAAIVPLPRAPAIVEGVINVRGRVVPVLDIRQRFRLPTRKLAPTDHFILAFAGDYVVALRADRVVELRKFRGAEIDDAATVLPYSEYVAGVAKLPGGLVLLHDIRTFLSQGEAAALAAPLAAAAAGPAASAAASPARGPGGSP
jgi:purine-binding chemotaxis protein CheW